MPALLLAACSAAGRPHRDATTPSPVRTSVAPSPPSRSQGSPHPTATSPSHPGIPPLSARQRAAGLVDVRTVVPDAVLDLRYATADNFTHVRLYPRDARCLVHESLAAGLRAAARLLRHRRLVLVFWDCYRPHTVQVRMFRVVPDPEFVARPRPYARSHEAARSVDVTLAHAGTHRLLDMGTGFDDFTPRAYAFATVGVSPGAQHDREVLRTAMRAGGLQVYAGEWWHFDGPGAFDPRPFLRVPVH